MTTADELIRKLDLKPLPGEGGFYRETYRSDGPSLSAHLFGIDSKTNRNISTAIYYLVTPEGFSALHKVKSDEIFHFYSGSPVEMIQIDEKGRATTTTIGSDILKGEFAQVVVPRGVWQATKLVDGGAWALMGTTVAPGFDFEDFELGDREFMLSLFPHLSNHIMKYTREQKVADE